MWMRLGFAVRPLGLSVGASIALALASPPATADVMRYQYSGTITTANPSSGVAVGTPFSGTFAYDPTGPQDHSKPIVYIPEAPIYTLARSTNGADLTASAGGRSILGPVDGLSVTAGGPFAYMAPGNPPANISLVNTGGAIGEMGYMKLSFINTDHAIASRYGLPNGFSLDEFTAAKFDVYGKDGKVLYEGAITGLIPEPTPEPSTLAILAAAVGVATLAKAHRRMKALPR